MEKEKINKDNSWKVETEINCEQINCPETETTWTVNIQERPLKQIYTLTRKYTNLEWMAALIGHETEEETTITQIQIYEQEVTQTGVKLTSNGNIQMRKESNIVGWIHSHNQMPVFTSYTDQETAKWNNITIVVNNKKEMIAAKTIKLSCGRTTLINCQIQIEGEDDEETLRKSEELIIEQKQKEQILIDYEWWEKKKAEYSEEGIYMTSPYDYT